MVFQIGLRGGGIPSPLGGTKNFAGRSFVFTGWAIAKGMFSIFQGFPMLK